MTLPAPLLRASTLSVQAGLPEAMTRLLRTPVTRPVADADGTVLAAFHRSARDGGTGRWLLRGLTGGARHWELRDPAGASLLGLRVTGRELAVADASGTPLGGARNVSRLSGPPDVAIEVYAARPAQRRGEVVARFSGRGDQDRFLYAVCDARGREVGRLANPGTRTYVLDDAGAGDELRTLLVGVLCGLVDRAWWRLPQRSSG